MGIGRPLEPGTYYVGVNNNTGLPMTFDVQSRGIGNAFTIPVPSLAFAGGSVTNTLTAREAAYYAVNVPSNTPSWKVKLRATAGESMLIALKDVLPSVASGGGVTGGSAAGLEMQKLGDEQFVLLPANNTSNLVAGTYYLTVVSEGINTTNNSRIGAGASTYELTSQGVLPVATLGSLTGSDLTLAGSLEGGEAAAYRFDVPPGTLAMEVRLENKTGNPAMALVSTNYLPQPNTSSYGAEGGQSSTSVTDDSLINVANPISGTWSIVVKANPVSTTYSPATYTVRVHRLFPTNVVFDGGSIVATNQEAGTWRYFRIDVPTNAFGWDVRLINVFTNNSPRFSVRRDLAPSTLSTGPWSFPQNSLTWPTGYQWGATLDWTDRSLNPDGRVDEYGRILAMGMGRPLEPGAYYLGVFSANSSLTNSMSYTVFSGVGVLISLRSMARYLHFTQVNVAYSHLGLYAFYSMIMFGSMYYIVPRLVGREWRYGSLIKLHFWTAVYGIGLMTVMLVAGGITQGSEINDPTMAFSESIQSVMPYMRGRSLAGMLMTVAHFVFAFHFGLMLFGMGRTASVPTFLNPMEADETEVQL